MTTAIADRMTRQIRRRRDLDLDGDRLREECGVFGIFGHPDAAAHHRARPARPAAPRPGGGRHRLLRRPALPFRAPPRPRRRRLLATRRSSSACPAASAIGHVRYSTTGGTHPAQRPAAVRRTRRRRRRGRPQRQPDQRPDAAPRAGPRRRDLPVDLRHRGDPAPRRARSPQAAFVDRFIDALRQIEGAYALVALTNKKLIGARDPLGIRPLVLGELDGSPILASETCALDIIGARFVRDIENGEIVVISEEGVADRISRSRRSRRGPASSNTSISPGRIRS